MCNKVIIDEPEMNFRIHPFNQLFIISCQVVNLLLLGRIYFVLHKTETIHIVLIFFSKSVERNLWSEH